MFYDAKFGRKRLSESQNGDSADQSAVSNGNAGAVVPNGSARSNTSDLAIYEQFRNQVLSSVLIIWSIRFDDQA